MTGRGRKWKENKEWRQTNKPSLIEAVLILFVIFLLQWVCLLCSGWRLKAETISFQSGESKETTWPSSDAKDRITLTRQSVSLFLPSLSGALCFVGFIFFQWNFTFLISRNLPGPVGKNHHFTHTTEFLFYLRTAKSIPVSCLAAAPFIPTKRQTRSVHPTDIHTDCFKPKCFQEVE